MGLLSTDRWRAGAKTRRWAAAAGLAIAVGSCKTESFGCDDDADCAGGGQCQWSNYCAFPDEACASGLRYGEHAGEFSTLCVQPLPQAADATGAAATDGDLGSSTDPTDDTSNAGSEAADSGDSGGPNSCTCYAPPPGDAWQGPILLRTGSAPDAVQPCPAATPSVLVEGVAGLQVAASECTHVSSECSATVELHDEQNPCAGQPFDTLTLQTGSCEALATRGAMGMEVYVSVPEDDCTCTAQPPAATIPAPTWEAAARLCGGSADECSEGSTCLPPPNAIAGDAICVYQPGELPCPLAGYAHRIVVYEGYDDTRECLHCAPQGPACTVAIAEDNCDEALANFGMFGDCFGFIEGGYSVFVYDEASDHCEGALELTGEVTPAGPTTVCCLP